MTLHKSITPLLESVSATKHAKREDNVEDFDEIGSNVIWGKDIENSRKIKGANPIEVKPQRSHKGPRIRLTARKSVPIPFQKFSFELPAPARVPKA